MHMCKNAHTHTQLFVKLFIQVQCPAYGPGYLNKAVCALHSTAEDDAGLLRYHANHMFMFFTTCNDLQKLF